MRVSLNPKYCMLICNITLILRVNINMHTRVTSAPRNRSRGSAWLCHVALHATSHPRGSRMKNKPLFVIFFNFFNRFKI